MSRRCDVCLVCLPFPVIFSFIYVFYHIVIFSKYEQTSQQHDQYDSKCPAGDMLVVNKVKVQIQILVARAISITWYCNRTLIDCLLYIIISSQSRRGIFHIACFCHAEAVCLLPFASMFCLCICLCLCVWVWPLISLSPHQTSSSSQMLPLSGHYRWNKSYGKFCSFKTLPSGLTLMFPVAQDNRVSHPPNSSA